MSLRILVVRFAAIGDCVMTAWAATALRKRFPDAEIVWALQAECAPVIDTHQLVNQLIDIPRRRWKARRWSPRTWREQLGYYASLRRLDLDVGFDFQGHSKTALCLYLAKPRQRMASRATDAFSKRLNPVKPTGGPETHEVDRAMALVNHFVTCEAPAKPIMPDLDAEARIVLTEMGRDRPLVTIQTGAGEEVKRYPIQQWEAVAAELAERGMRVLGLGAAGDPPLFVQNAPEVKSKVGKYPLVRSMGAVLASDLHLAADTGTGHVAAAYGVPVVSVFSKNDPQRFRPYAENAKVLRHGKEAARVRSAEVVEAAHQLLQEKQRALFD